MLSADGAVLELERDLRRSADALQATTDAAEYKYVVPAPTCTAANPNRVVLLAVVQKER